eukprot:3516761-Amphidinium_carterae.1
MNISVPQEPAAKRRKAEVEPSTVSQIMQDFMQKMEGHQQKMEDSIATVNQKLEPVLAVTLLCPMKDEESATTAWDVRADKFRQEMVCFYDPPSVNGVPSCMVLGSLFPELNAPAGSWQNKIQAVAEHIFPKSHARVALDFWRLNVWDPQNGIFLLKDLELKFQSFQWVLIPLARTEWHGQVWYSFEIFVSEPLKSVPITYYAAGTTTEQRTVVTFKGQPLYYGYLHKRVIYLRNKPFMRSLWAMAHAAHREHEDLPDPALMMERFIPLCEQLQPLTEVFMQRLPERPHELLSQDQAFGGDT